MGTNVSLGVVDVDPAVCDVEVAAPDDGLLRVELLEVGEERVVPAAAVRPVHEALGRVGHVRADDKERRVLGRDDAPLVVERGVAEAAVHGERRRAREEGGPVAPGRVLALVERHARVARGELLRGHHALGDLRLLQAQHVGLLARDVVAEALLEHRAEPRDVPRHDLHARHARRPHRRREVRLVRRDGHGRVRARGRARRPVRVAVLRARRRVGRRLAQVAVVGRPAPPLAHRRVVPQRRLHLAPLHSSRLPPRCFPCSTGPLVSSHLCVCVSFSTDTKTQLSVHNRPKCGKLTGGTETQ